MQGLLIGLVAVSFIFYIILSTVVQTPNATAVAVKNHALTPKNAVILSSIFTFVGTAFIGLSGKYFIEFLPKVLSSNAGLNLLLSTFLACFLWEIYTLYRGNPTSPLHIFIVAFLGASTATTFFDKKDITDGIQTSLLFWVVPLILLPLLSFILSYVIVTLIQWFSRNSQPNKTTEKFRKGEIVLSALMSFGQGVQSGIRNFSILCLILIALEMENPQHNITAWVIIGVAILTGCSALLRGWPIAKTLSTDMVRLDPMRGFASGIVPTLMTNFASLNPTFPLYPSYISTTSIIGAGANQKFSTLRPKKILRVILNWFLSIPVCFALSFIFFLALKPIFG